MYKKIKREENSGSGWSHPELDKVLTSKKKSVNILIKTEMLKKVKKNTKIKELWPIALSNISYIWHLYIKKKLREGSKIKTESK